MKLKPAERRTKARVRILMLAGLLATAACVPAPNPIPLQSPSATGAALPRLSHDPEGRVWLSWVEPAAAGHALHVSVLGEHGWEPARTAAQGTGWFVNWADFPSVVHFGEQRLAAHWLRKLDGGPYAYELLMSVSVDGGASWSTPVTPHGDGTATEHGFASLFAVDEGAGAVWLDGRHTGGGDDHDAHGHGHGAMSLRAGGIDWSGQPLPEVELDGMTCDCCPTAAVSGPHGVTVVYRDRSAEEIRDILAMSFDGDAWSAPVPVAEDGWLMPACPVNGPALAARGDRMVAAWFTAAGELPRIRAAFSSDGGRSWSPPVDVAGGTVLGRVAVVMPDRDAAVVSWLEADDARAAIRYRRVHPSGRHGAVRTLTTTSPARSSGFPQMALAGDRLVFAWTEAGEPSAVATATVPLP